MQASNPNYCRRISKIFPCTAAMVLFLLTLLAPSRCIARPELLEIGDAISTDVVEIRGVTAGAFNPAAWSTGTLHWLPDVRSPLFEPRPGKARNIYAPSIVARPNHWEVFYGAWDGVPTCNDRIYQTTTTDFLTFGERHMIIDHGEFEHVCNVSAEPLGDHGFALLCTGYPDSHGRNKPVFFTSFDGTQWNGMPPPLSATRSSIVAVSGYPNYDNADINGMNVLLRDGDQWRMYFADFQNFGTIYRATSDNGTSFTLDGPALKQHAAPNDIKRFQAADRTKTYLMGLHMNGGKTWYAMSTDGLHFNPPQEMFRSNNAADAYIVAVGFVTTGEHEGANQKILGVLYGAGAAPTLDRNRIFARWLQKRVVITADTTETESFAAYGPDRQLFHLPPTASGHWDVTIYDDNKTTTPTHITTKLQTGKAYTIKP